jgi:transposase
MSVFNFIQSITRKLRLVRELLEGGYIVSQLSEKYQIHPTQLMRWKKELLEGGAETFNRKSDKREQRHEK